MPNATTPATIQLPHLSGSPDTSLSQLQQQFNSKITRIQQLKQDLKDREASLGLARKRIHQELHPLTAQLIEKRVELVHLLDAAYGLSFFRKTEKARLAQLLQNLAFSLIRNHGRTDLIALYDRYAEKPFAEASLPASEQQPDEQPLSDNSEPEIDWNNLSAEELQAQLDKEASAREAGKYNRQASRKTKAQQQKENHLKQELQNISKASRRVYTDLAKQLHPDTEQNEEVRAWKEEAMKKVTNAYHNDDFFELLQLQMEFMVQQQKPLHLLPEDQLSYYVKILDEQIKELQEQLHEFTYGTGPDVYDLYSGTPKQMNQRFKQVKENLLLTLANLNQELKALQDPHQIRVLLKGLH